MSSYLLRQKTNPAPEILKMIWNRIIDECNTLFTYSSDEEFLDVTAEVERKKSESGRRDLYILNIFARIKKNNRKVGSFYHGSIFINHTGDYEAVMNTAKVMSDANLYYIVQQFVRHMYEFYEDEKARAEKTSIQ